MLIAGIDEAGRGSVLGPLVIAGVMMEIESLETLSLMGVKDSKAFTSPSGKRKRIILEEKIKNLAQSWVTLEVPAKEIDQVLRRRPVDNLNLLEIRKISQIIVDLCADLSIIDSVSKQDYFLRELLIALDKLSEVSNVSRKKNVRIPAQVTAGEQKQLPAINVFIKSKNKLVVAENKADRNYPIVSAASIIAKVARDLSLRRIESENGYSKDSVGFGYPNKNDANIMSFLKEHALEIRAKKLPFIRYSWNWAPLQEILRVSKLKL